MKVVAQMRIPAMLMLDNQEVIVHHKPSLVTMTEFLQIKALRNEVKLSPGTFKDEATDAEFQKFYQDADNNLDLAIDSFSSKFGTEEETPVSPPLAPPPPDEQTVSEKQVENNAPTASPATKPAKK